MSKEIIPAEFQDFASLMVEEILAKLRVKINNGGWTIDEQREILDCVVEEQEVKHRLRAEIASLRKQLEDAREVLGFAVDRMQWLEDWRNGEKANIPSCEAALIVANKALKGKS